MLCEICKKKEASVQMVSIVNGKKIGMTQIFDETGKVIPVTVIEAGPCVVVQKKTIENDGYESVQLGFGDVKIKNVTKPLQGHFKKADVECKKTLTEFRFEFFLGSVNPYICNAEAAGSIHKITHNKGTIINIGIR